MALANQKDKDSWYLSLLGLAEHFRMSNPPDIKTCIQCLQAVFNFEPPLRVEARTHLQLGQLLLAHTKNVDLAVNHLEKAWMVAQRIPPNIDYDVKYEAASEIANYYDQNNKSKLVQQILRKAIELSQQNNNYWHCKLIFQLAQNHVKEKDFEAAQSLLQFAIDLAGMSNVQSLQYTKILFQLSRCMILLIEKKVADAGTLLTSSGYLVESWQGSSVQKEHIRIFFLVLQVCHHFMEGRIKNMKPFLKQLQQSIMTLMQQPSTLLSDETENGSPSNDSFIWMPKEQLYVVVYLVTVMHSVQAGYMDKAQKYIDKALLQIEKIRDVEDKPILALFELILFEHNVMCRLVMGNKSVALKGMTQICSLCKQHKRLFESHLPQIHALVGLYAMSTNNMNAAEVQFNSVIRLSQDKELKFCAYLNLALIYLRLKRDIDYCALLEKINPDSLPTNGMKSAVYFIQGLQSFFQNRYNEAKRYLREALKMANSEDLNRLMSCSLVLLGHIFLCLGNTRESMNMVTPAMQLASKIPDIHIQLWATAILKDLYKMCNDPVRESETFQLHGQFSRTLLSDHFQCSEMPEHTLIHWTDASLPEVPYVAVIPALNGVKIASSSSSPA